MCDSLTLTKYAIPERFCSEVLYLNKEALYQVSFTLLLPLYFDTMTAPELPLMLHSCYCLVRLGGVVTSPLCTS